MHIWVLLLNSYMIYWSVIHIRTFDNLCGKKYQFTSIKWKNKCCSIIDMSSLHVLNITGVPLTFLGCPMDLKDQWRVNLQSFINCLFSIDIEVYSWYHDSHESGLLRFFLVIKCCTSKDIRDCIKVLESCAKAEYWELTCDLMR